MSTSPIVIIVLAALALVAALFVVGIYNKLVGLRNHFKNAFAQIEVQLKRRYDLIPNLIETAKGYLKHERGTLEAVIAARNAAAAANTGAAANPGDPTAMKTLARAEGTLTGTLGRLFALSEAYPDLKANTTMLSLMEELTSTENKVSFSRQAYNDSVMAVVCIIASVYIVSLLIFYGTHAAQPQSSAPPPQLVLWDPKLFLYSVLGTLGVVIMGSLYKTAALTKGGGAVAESLGGRLVPANTNHPDERQLRNVIEEMAIAAGVPVPTVYVLDDEKGINAFAAGHTPGDAAIGVTRGCMTLLNRDELQGVIGHEFSHILNGDMRLNLRIMGIIFGILCLAVIGRILIYSRGGRDRNPLMLLGLALIVIGAIGAFFGRLIQAALSRQREFLADASAVQFTRNPAGLSGALQKIGGAGSQVESAHAGEASHMFFGNGMGKPFLGMLATHPPLDERIRAIDPGWDGQFRIAGVRAVETESSRGATNPALSRSSFPRIPGMPGARAGDAGFTTNAVLMGAVLPHLGKPTPLHLRYAEELRSSFPVKVQSAAREPLDATALVYAMLLSPDQTLRAKQLAELVGRAAPGVGEQTAALWPEVAPIASRARLPLANLALPALRQLRPDEFEQFSQTLQWLIQSDDQVEIFEFVLQKIVRRRLASQLGETRPASIQYDTLKPLLLDCKVVLSALAHASSRNAGDIEKAFRTGAPHLGATADGLQLLPRAECGLDQLDTALDRLALAAPQIKKKLLESCVQVVGADGLIQEREAELLRAIADTLDCPIPPFQLRPAAANSHTLT